MSNRITDELDGIACEIETGNSNMTGTQQTNGDQVTISDQQAQAVIQAGKERRSKACSEELTALLAKYRCSLSFQQLWVNGVPQQGQIALIALD
jgi:hypothetical protein